MSIPLANTSITQPVPGPSTTAQPKIRPTRHVFIDRLRGWAVIVMIETHVLNALIERGHRGEPFHEVLNFINGLVAPSFLFCAGFAFAISSLRKWDEYISFGRAARQYARRLLFILAVGYSLHLPFFSLRRVLDLNDPASWTSFFQVDILQTIATGLLLLLLLAVLLRTRRVHVAVVAILTAVFVFGAPVVNHGLYPWLPIWLRGYFSHAYLSQFPIFPWTGFLFAGFLMGDSFTKAHGVDRQALMKNLALISVAGIGISILAALVPIRIYPGLPFWGDSPQFYLLRVSIVVLITCLLFGIEPAEKTLDNKRSNDSGWRVMPTVPLLFGRESLLVYTVHLLIVYGQDYDWSLIRKYGQSFTYIECFGMFLLVSLAMYILALGWDRLKAYDMVWAKRVQYAVVAMAIFRFMTG